MPQGGHVQTNFTAGELSPRLLGRTDLAKYANGLSLCENLIVQKHGGEIRRSGTRFVVPTKLPPQNASPVLEEVHSDQSDGVPTTNFAVTGITVAAGESLCVVASSFQAVSLGEPVVDWNAGELLIKHEYIESLTRGTIGVWYLQNPTPATDEVKITFGANQSIIFMSVYRLSNAAGVHTSNAATLLATSTPSLNLFTTVDRCLCIGGFFTAVSGSPVQDYNYTDSQMTPRKFSWFGVLESTTGSVVQDMAGTQIINVGIDNGAADHQCVAVAIIPFLSSADTRLIEFQFSVADTYVLEFGAQYIRFMRDKGQLEASPGVPTEIASPYADQELFDIKFTQSADQLFLCHPNHETRILSRVPGPDNDPASWTLTTLNAQDGPYFDINPTNNEATPVGGPGPGLVTINFDTTENINGGAGFTTDDIGRWFRMDNLTPLGGPTDPTETWGAGFITQIFSTTSIEVNFQFALAHATDPSDVWRLGAWGNTPGWPWTVTFHQERLFFGGTNAQPQTLFASRTGLFDEFRPSDPTDGTVFPTDGIVRTISDNKVNAVRFLLSDTKGLIVGTDGGPFVASGITERDPITPTDLVVNKQGTDGAHVRVRPWQIEAATLYPKSGGRKVMEFVYRFEDDRFAAPDMTILSEHITLRGLVDSAYMQEPDRILWLVRGDGVLLSMTYERSEQVVAWTRQLISGDVDGVEWGKVESIALIRDGNDDLLYMIVRRKIDGTEVRYIEFLHPTFDLDDRHDEAIMVDCNLSYDPSFMITAITQANPAVVTTLLQHGYTTGDEVRLRDVLGMEDLNDLNYTIRVLTDTTFELQGIDTTAFPVYEGGGVSNELATVLSGFGHLEGETVAIMADGATHAEKVVVSGAITLDYSASRVHVGLPYVSRSESLPIMAQAQGVDPRGRQQRADNIVFNWNRSVGGLYGVLGDTLMEIAPREGDEPLLQEAPILITKRERFPSPTDHSRDLKFVVEQHDPQPFNLLSIAYEMVVDDE